ncbi:MAG: flagellar filament capping protein FliD [Solirubrobacteraceae bacterium]
MSTSSVSSSTNPYGLITDQSIQSSSGLSSNSTLTNNGAGGTLQITGLASGINTTELIQAELAQQELPLENMQNDITSLQTENTALTSLQSLLQNTSFDALTLSEPSLFFLTQTVFSSDPSLITASATDNVGAVIGSATVEVAQLADASQATFDYTSPTGSEGDTLSVQVGSNTAQTINIAQGESLSTLASDINSSNTLGVWASDSNGQLVLSSRTTGTGNLITATTTDVASGAANSDVSVVSSQDGQDAEVYINGSSTAVSSPTDTVTNAIPGVTLTLNGVTAANTPVTITTSSPAPDQNSILQAVNQFVGDYNSAVEAIEAQVNTAPAGESNPSAEQSDPGSLFGDPQLEDLLSQMRQSIYADDSSLPSGFQSLEDLGISTGQPTGQATLGSIDGLLTVNTSQLEQAIQQNPAAVEQALSSWASGFQTTVNNAASPTGSLQTRLNGNNTLITSMQSQLESMTSLYDQEESNMEAQWAKVEATLQNLDSQKTTLTGFAASLGSSSSSSTG